MHLLEEPQPALAPLRLPALASQEENQRLKEGGALAAADTEPMEADDDEPLKPSSRGMARAARLRQARQQLSEEGEDESGSEDEDHGHSQSPPRDYD